MPGALVLRAYRRARVDAEERAFFLHPCDITLFDVAQTEFLDDIEGRCDAGTFNAGPMLAVEEPKANWHSRPSIAIPFRDHVAYTYLAMKVAPLVAERMKWSERTVRFSYRLARDRPQWFVDQYKGWSMFRNISLAKLAGAYPQVLFADIAGYYDNIEIGRLVQELQDAGADATACRQLSTLWNKWSGPRRRGIPQAFAPSHVFGEFYLDPVDRWLQTRGLDHTRYLDDFRVFVGSEKTGRAALSELARVLRDRGLNLQTAKTVILDSRTARAELSAVEDQLTRISTKMAKELIDFEGDYADPDDVTRLLNQDPDHPSADVVENAWASFIAGELGPFNKTIFHYLMSRLAEQRSAAAVAFAVQQLEDKPEETLAILQHLRRVRALLGPGELNGLASLVEGDRLLYDFQRYQLLRWFHADDVAHPLVVALARVLIERGPSLVRLWAISYLGKHASQQVDFELLARQLTAENDPMTRATLLLSLRRAPLTLRNEWFSRCRGEGNPVDLAVRLANQPT